MPALGVALILTCLMLAREGDGLQDHPGLPGPGLMLLGTVGLFILPLWPMMYPLNWLPLWFGALIYAACGAGWVTFGLRLRAAPARAAGNAYA